MSHPLVAIAALWLLAAAGIVAAAYRTLRREDPAATEATPAARTPEPRAADVPSAADAVLPPAGRTAPAGHLTDSGFAGARVFSGLRRTDRHTSPATEDSCSVPID